MKFKIFFVILINIVALLLASCIEFNTCDENRGTLAGYVPQDIDITKIAMRTKENMFGNMVADAIFHAATEYCQNGSPCPDLAMINAGSIRNDYGCGTRQMIPKGAIFENDIESILPFKNHIVVVELKGSDIRYALEHGVSLVGLENRAASFFPHVSQVEFEVECDKPGQTLSEKEDKITYSGNRVKQLSKTMSGLARALELNKYYEVATTTYLADGKNGYLAYLQRDYEQQVINDQKSTPIVKYNLEEDIVLNDKKEPMSAAQALKLFLKNKKDKKLTEEAEAPGKTRPRILLGKNCPL